MMAPGAAPDTATMLRAQAAALDAQAATLRAMADALGSSSADRVYGLDEMAERRNLSPNTLRTWAKSGRLHCRSGSRKQYLTTDADVDDALAADVSPRTGTRKPEPVADDFDALDAELRRGGIVLGAA
jgi:hypothetical protein